MPGSAGPPSASQVAWTSLVSYGSPPGGRLADGEQEPVRHDDVDLLVEEAVLLGDGDRHQHDAEDVVVVALDRGPRLVLVLRGREQPRNSERVERLPETPPQLGFVRIDEVDPLGRRPSAEASGGSG